MVALSFPASVEVICVGGFKKLVSAVQSSFRQYTDSSAMAKAASSSSAAPRGVVTERRDTRYSPNLERCSSVNGEGFFCSL